MGQNSSHDLAKNTGVDPARQPKILGRKPTTRDRFSNADFAGKTRAGVGAIRREIAHFNRAVRGAPQ